MKRRSILEVPAHFGDAAFHTDPERYISSWGMTTTRGRIPDGFWHWRISVFSSRRVKR